MGPSFFSEVKSKIEKLKAKYEKFQDMLKTVDTSSNAEFKELQKGMLFALFLTFDFIEETNIFPGLTKDIRVADKQIKELKGTVDMVIMRV